MKKIIMMVVVFFACIVDNSLACTGARPLGMGGGFIGLSDDANVTYYNPAAIVFLPEDKMETHEGEPYGSIKYTKNNSMTLRISDKRGLGISDTYNTGGSSIRVRYDIQWSGLSYRSNMWAGSVTTEEKWNRISYAQRVSKRSAVGVNFNVISPVRPFQSPEAQSYLSSVNALQQRIENSSAPIDRFAPTGGVAYRIYGVEVLYPQDRYQFDFSYRLNINDDLSFGILLQQAIMWYGGDYFSMDSLNPRVGIAYHNDRLKIGVDWYEGPKSYSMKNILAGAEYRVNNKLSLRRGSYAGIETWGIGYNFSPKQSLNISAFGDSYLMGYSKSF